MQLTPVTKKATPRGASTPATPPATDEPRSLVQIERDAARAAGREALLAELERQDWNLTATAKALGLSHPSNLIRAIHRLGLSEQYETAKAGGRIPKGPRS